MLIRLLVIAGLSAVCWVVLLLASVGAYEVWQEAAVPVAHLHDVR